MPKRPPQPDHVSRGKKRRRLAPFVLASVLAHLLLMLLFLLLSSYESRRAPVAVEPKFIEITELPVPPEKETKPPEKTERLAQRSHRAKKQTVRDDFTRRGAVASVERKTARPEKPTKPAPKPKETAASRRPPRQKKAAEKPLVASLPREIERPELPAPRTPTVDEMLKTPSLPPPSRPQPSRREFLGDRNLPKEDTVDLNTTEFKYFSYFMKLKRKIESVWTYPRESVMRGEQGELLLVFTIRSDGRLEGVKILNSSLHARLDEEAVRAIKVAAPFYPFPKSWGLERLNVRAVFSYRLGYWSVTR